MGGTFDPIHIAHLILGEQAYEQCGLDEIWYLPNGNPPHKKNRSGRATEQQRLEMTKLAIADNPHFQICDIEMQEEGYSFSYQTMEKLCALHPDTDFYFIIGADSLFTLNSWMRPDLLLKYCTMLAAVRDHASIEDLNQEILRIQEQYPYAKIETISTENMDISSNMLRHMIQEQRSVRYYVTESVREYILNHKIYADFKED